jgi:hypothetical protein
VETALPLNVGLKKERRILLYLLRKMSLRERINLAAFHICKQLDHSLEMRNTAKKKKKPLLKKISQESQI